MNKCKRTGLLSRLRNAIMGELRIEYPKMAERLREREATKLIRSKPLSNKRLRFIVKSLGA